MENQKLPNVTIALVLAILSILCCCLPYGMGSVLLAGIALYLIKKDAKVYLENPDMYSNYGQLKTAKIIAIIGLVIGVILLVISVYMSATGQDQVFQEYLEELQRELEANQ
tara:strand:- start:15871 stop:16203 length:333 start_codon:yes stop_codon:yes gene_type:complete